MSVEGAIGEVRLPPEPVTHRTRPPGVATRLWCGSVTFFFASFLFAYVFLRSLDVHKDWVIGHVEPSGGLGVTVMALMVLSGIIWRIGHFRPVDTIATGVVAIVLGIVAVALQILQYTTIDFGGASGAYASVFIGWTSTYILGAIPGLYWIETQLATLVRARKREVSEADQAVLRAGVEASSFFWAYYAAIGVVTFIFLYVI